MGYKKKHAVPQLLVIWALLIGCNSSNGDPPNRPNPSPTLQEISTLTRESATFTPYRTLIPTLETSLARQRVAELFETNNNCKLPCWWGITPGKTKWDDASSILTPVSLKIYLDFPRRQKESITVNVIPPVEIRCGSYLAQEYFVESDIVTEITLWYNFDLAKFTDFKPFIREYGAPDQIYIHGYGETPLDNWPFQIALFYPQQGMLLEYSGSPVIQGDNLIVCWGEEHFPAAIHLWVPTPHLTFEDVIAKNYVPDSTDLPPYKSMTDVVINPDHFFDGLNDLQQNLCLETPQEVWLERK